MPAWLIPAAIGGGFALLFLLLFGDRLLPAPEVDVARVVATSGETSGEPERGTAGQMLFQASGWIEPDPQPIKATALIDGVIQNVGVLDGEMVERGQVLASLIAEDAELELEAAGQTRNILGSERKVHLASIRSARRKLESARAVAKAEGSVRDAAVDLVERYAGMSDGVIAETEVVAARFDLERAESAYLAAVATAEEYAAEIERLELLTMVKDEQLRAAEIAVAKAELALSRTRIVAPADGRVLRLLAAPGRKMMSGSEDPDSSTVAILYDPEKLQVRVDVPLADAAGLQIGQPTKIHCSLLPDTVFHGEVTRITGEADVQRNTLQTKVRIDDPADQLRPEMLCRVEFLETTAGPADPGGAGGALVTWIPQAAEDDGVVWICHPDSGRVSQREVEPGGERRDGFVRVNKGLRPGEWVVLSPGDLRDGQRITPNLVQP